MEWDCRPERLARITEMMQRRIAAGDVSGGVTLVSRKGRIAHLEAHGLMDIESKKPMAKDAVFRIASMTKPVVGVAIMMMLEEGKLRITDPVSKFIPELKDDEGRHCAGQLALTPAAGEEPAARAVLHGSRRARDHGSRSADAHLRSGQWSDEHERGAQGRPQADRYAWPTTFRASATTPLEFQPGSRWSYSPGAGFDTLARIVEIASGQNFDQFLRQRVFDPLGMKDISFYATETLGSRMPTAYDATPERSAQSGKRQPDDPAACISLAVED